MRASDAGCSSDLFDGVLNLEDQYIREGRDEGIRLGRERGRVESRELGVSRGFAMGYEVGSASGAASALRAAEAASPGTLSARALRALEALEAALSKCDPLELRSPGGPEALVDVRSRFKVLLATVGGTRLFRAGHEGDREDF